jgi:copper transport protein
VLNALTAAPDDPDLTARLRSTLTAEAIVLTFVVTVTAWLVAAAS